MPRPAGPSGGVETRLPILAGGKKPLIFRGFNGFDACGRALAGVYSEPSKGFDAADAKGFAHGQRMEPQPRQADGSARPPRPIDQPDSPAQPRRSGQAIAVHPDGFGHRRVSRSGTRETSGPARTRLFGGVFSLRS